MKISSIHLIFLLLTFKGMSVLAFPPAPHHTFTGMVRDELGRPLDGDDVEVLFETTSGLLIRGIVQHRSPGVNYKLNVPMDSGATGDLYHPTAMVFTMPYKIRVMVGGKVYLPIEMLGDFSKIGKPSERTIMNLTLGEDADRDGLPDAWEKALLAKGGTINDIKPGDDSDGDGMSNIDEYISGNYAFDKNNGLRLAILNSDNDGVLLEFMGLKGRTYTLHGSSDLKSWDRLSFKLDGNDEFKENLRPINVKNFKINVSKEKSGTSIKFFKLMVQ